jgi:DNA uptake protein ComE-like DNA-binding protein
VKSPPWGPWRPWSLEHRQVLIALLCVMLVYLIARLILNPAYVSNPQPHVPARANEVEDRIDPNTADVATLAALPLIGEKRARDVVTYREQYVAEHPGKLAFEKPNDLLHIRGIGPAMLEQIQPYLIFSKPPATTGTE